MKRMAGLWCAAAGWLTAAAGLEAAERVSVGLFKNGLAVVRREIDLVEAGGSYRIEDLPPVIHGTFRVDGDAPLRAYFETGEVARTVQALVDFRDLPLLAGREVTLHVRDRQPPVLSGVILASPRDAGRPPPAATPYYGGWMPPPAAATPGLIALRAGDETTWVDPAAIVSASVPGPGGPYRATERKPVLVIAPAPGQKAKVCVLSYLAQGGGWAPGYQVDLLGKGRLRIAQDAVIRTEGLAIGDADVSLITGYPNIEFGHVRSPLAPDITWNMFLAQSAADPRANSGGHLGRNFISQQVVFNSAAGADAASLPAAPAGEGHDIHWQPAGRLTLRDGGGTLLRVADATAAFEPIVMWEVPDRRNARGRYDDHRDDADQVAESPWDAVRFANPFAFPMTTAPVVVSDGARVLGQSISYWTRPGEKTLVRVNKALSVRVRQEELEEAGERPVVWVAGNDYQKCAVKATLLLTNGRGEKIRFLLRRKLSGDVLSAQGSPADRLLEEGIWCVNARHELTWEFELAPGETRQIEVRYSVLVDR